MHVVALFGPTGVGKTAVAIALADRLRARGEQPLAVSADALQVYRGLELLSGAATPEERERLEHRLLSFLDPREVFSAGEFAALAHAEIDGALEKGRRPIVVGGTGLYLQAALTDLELRPPPDPAVRERIQRELSTRGPEALHEELARRAPGAAAGDRPARPNAREPRARAARDGGGAGPGRRGVAALDRAAAPSDAARGPHHGSRLALRAHRRARGGDGGRRRRRDEVRQVDAAGASRTARAALGFDELLRGDVEAMKRRTRNYAKRQLTWMRRLAAVHEIDLTKRSVPLAGDEITHILATQPGEAQL